MGQGTHRPATVVERNVTGKVKWFNARRVDPETQEATHNYGFIRIDGVVCTGEDDHEKCGPGKCGPGTIWVHGSGVHEDSYPLKDNDLVCFDIAENKRGRQAVSVVRVPKP